MHLNIKEKEEKERKNDNPYKLNHHVQDTFTNQVETGENHNIMFIQTNQLVST